MNRNILKIVVIFLSIAAGSIVLSGPGVAQDSRPQDAATTTRSTERNVEQVFKNIKVLNGLPQSKLYPTMRFMAASLGFQCGSCHVIRNGVIDSPADDKPEKQTAREMIKMVIGINQTLFDGKPTVSCYTCHGGHRAPRGAPALPLPTPPPRAAGGAQPAVVTGVPAADDVLNRYLAAIGGKAAADLITSCVAKGTTTTAFGQVVPYEAETVAPDKGHESFALPDATAQKCAGDSRCEYQRTIIGGRGWLKSGAGVQELLGGQVADQKLSFPLFQILKLKDQYASLRAGGRDRIDDREMYVLNAVRFDGKSESLYFDIEKGLLRRRISYLPTFVGTIPQQTDFEDYREVDSVNLPFTIRMAFADPGSIPITRKFAEIKLNVPVPESSFAKPQ